MWRQYVQYTVIASGALALLFVMAGYLRPRGDSSKPTIDALVSQVQNAENPQSRVEAALQLARAATPDHMAPPLQVLAPLRQTLTSPHEPPGVRAAAADALGQWRDLSSMDQLLLAMEDSDPYVRGRASMAVRRILGADYYFRATDPPAQRRQALAVIRQDWEKFKQRPRPDLPRP
jgi:HEAT repeat protein